MDVSDIQTAVVEHGFSDFDTARMITYINNQYLRVCSLEPWPFMEQVTALSTSSAFISTPTDWSKTLSFVMYFDSNMSQLASILTPLRLDSSTKTFTNQTATGTPNFYYFQGDDFIYFYPSPNRTFYYRHAYVRKATELNGGSTTDTDILLPARHTDILLYGTLMDCSAARDDYDAANFYKRLRDERVAEMRADVFEQQYDRPDYIERIDPDDWGIDW